MLNKRLWARENHLDTVPLRAVFLLFVCSHEYFPKKDHNYNLHSSEDEDVGIVMSPRHSFLAVPLPSGDLTGNAGDLPESQCASEESCPQMAPEQTEQQGLEGRGFSRMKAGSRYPRTSL